MCVCVYVCVYVFVCAAKLLRFAIHTISKHLQNTICELHNWRLVSGKALRKINALYHTYRF